MTTPDTFTAEQWKWCKGLIAPTLDLADEILTQARELDEDDNNALRELTPSGAVIAAATIITASIART